MFLQRLAVVFLLSATVNGDGVPCKELLKGKCDCIGTSDGITIKNCQNLVEVPNFSNMAEAKNFSIRHVDLSNQKITTIKATDFEPLSYNFFKLNLSNNAIETIEAKAFYNMTGTIEIYLDGNKLTRVPTDAFPSTPDVGFLRTLSLSRNLIKKITTSDLNNLPSTGSILRVDLSFNPLEQCIYDDGGIKQLEENLMYLNLSHTYMTEVPEGFILENLATFDISSSRLRYLTGVPFALMGLKSSSSSVKLDISNNTLENIPEVTFKDLHIHQLIMSRCGLHELPPHILSLKQLTHLDLSYNSLTDFNLPETDPTKQTEFNLQHLLLAGNELKTVPDDICSRFKQISVLDVYENPIKEDLSVTLDKLKTCVSPEISVFWSHITMNCSCEQFMSWYSGDSQRQLKAYNGAYTESLEGTTTVVCSSHSSKALQGQVINDLDKDKVDSLCSGAAVHGAGSMFILLLAFLLHQFLSQ